MRTVILYICIFLGVIAAHAQSFLFRLPAFFKDTTEASLQKILLENNILYPDLKLVRHAETLSRFGIHLHFDVLLRGVPLSEAGLILNFYPDGPTGYVTGYIPPEVPVYETAGPGEWYMYWKQYIRAVRIDTLGTIQRYWAQGELLHSRDLASYHKDTTISFPLFLPDPVSVSGKDYGFTVADSNDRDLVAFAALYQTVSVPMEVSKDSIFFKNKFVQIADISGRKRTVSGVPRGSFTVNRSDSLFEALQVLFHIYQYKSYIDSLGFQQLLPMAIPVDPHGTPADQSSFIPTYLIFGDGGVDDAEDAEVIIHEYGHALIEGATPGTNIGFYRKAADEGTCDYLATGYTKQLSLFKPFEIFPWDGHNEFWQGRIINATATFPGGVNNNSIHLTGQLWSSSLNEIAAIIGRNTLDQLLLESYYAFSSNLSFQQMAEILMVTDSLLYGGKYHFALCHGFTLRGFINGNCYNGQVSVNEREKPCMRVDHNTLYISNLPDEKWNLSISDLQGKSIYYNRFEGRTISTTHLFAPGIYLVTLDSDTGFSYTQKLIMIE